MELANDHLTFCGRCSQQFQGGPGQPFCNQCIADINRENGVSQQEIDQANQIPQAPNPNPTNTDTNNPQGGFSLL